MDGFAFSALKDSGIHRSPRYCSLKLVYVCKIYAQGYAPLLMGIYDNYSGYYNVRRRLYVNETFDKINVSGKDIKKWT